MKNSKGFKYKYIKIAFAVTFLITLTVILSALFMYSRISSSLLHRRSTEKVIVSLDPKDFPFERIAFKSRMDQLNLQGILFKSSVPCNKTLILVHGFDENRMMFGRTEKLVEFLVPQGYNIFAFDLRGQGESDGNLISFGYYEKYDLLGAVDYLKQYGVEGERVAVLGFSMGGATALLAAGQTEVFDAVIADSTFSDLRDFIKKDLNCLPSNLNTLSSNLGDLSYWSILRHFPFKDKFIQYYAGKNRINISEVSPVNAVKNMAEKPVFLIHGKKDRLISHTNSEAIYNCIRSNPNSMLWITDKAGHVESLTIYTEQYLAKVKSFLDRSLR